MITLDQIKQLDFKVRKAIEKINSLKSANDILQEKLETYQLRIEELEILIDTYKEDQGAIEHGIIDALNQLDILEDNIVIPTEDLEEEELSSEETEEDNKEESNLEETEGEDEMKIISSSEPEVETDQSVTVDQSEEENSTDSEIELDIF